jgi:ATP-dependent Zn protease
MVDAEVSEILSAAYERAKTLLTTHEKVCGV